MARNINGKGTIPKKNDEEKNLFPIVAIGSSAGGLEALESFFSNIPPDSDMAFIVIAHLEPHHPSLMAEIISKSTKMEAAQAKNDMHVEKNRIYVIPPGKDMMIVNRKLRLFNRETGHEPFMPIDFFFRSLAADQKENAIAIVLSGNGSDGSFGIKSINGNLGLVVVQSPQTAKYDNMPRNAIETGVVDYVLAPEEMPDAILKYVTATKNRHQPPRSEPSEGTDNVQKILAIVKTETGHDFSLYKKSTINRRIERRMTVHQLETKDSYANYLLNNRQEIRLLFKELIIEVTSFFRNPEAFKALKDAIRSHFFDPNSERRNLRIWVAACATGEEAYSIGIILRELMDETRKDIQIQIFGSDINEEAIAFARVGEYPLAIADDVDSLRLNKFFVKTENGYKIKKIVREMIIFAPHNAVRDPPFIHLDMLSCRNLLIYFEPTLQRKVLETFSSALNPNGILFLGESETVTGFEGSFVPLDPKWKLYSRRPYSQPIPIREIEVQPQRVKHKVEKETGVVRGPSTSDKADKILLSEYAPPSIIVNNRNEVIYFHGKTSRYLEHPQGKATLGISDLVREEFRYAVLSAMTECRNSGKQIVKEAVKVHTNGGASFLNVIVRPLDERMPIFDMMVIFDEKTIPQNILKERQELAIKPDQETKISELERELAYTKENLQSTIEELETSNEELTSTNEELQSNNEELQSVVEESETGKEELNSLNEELLTVNSELEIKNQELSRTSSDMRNLLYGIDEALIFLDVKLRIRRYTPQMEKIMNLLPGDVGRPIHDIAMKFRYEDLVSDVRDVLDKLNTKQEEVQTKDGHWYRVKIIPYRTIENVIDGVVITFTDIDEQKRVQEMYRVLSSEKSNSTKLAECVADFFDEPTLILNNDLTVQMANHMFYSTFNSDKKLIEGHQVTKILEGLFDTPKIIGKLDLLKKNKADNGSLSIDLNIPSLGTKNVKISIKKQFKDDIKSPVFLLHFKIKN